MFQRGSFVRQIVGRGSLRLKGTNLETKPVLSTGVLRGEVCRFAKVAGHDKPVAADNFFALTERAVSDDARLGNNSTLAAETAAHLHFILVNVSREPIVEFVDGRFDVFL